MIIGVVLGAADNIARWDGANWSALGSNGAGDGSINSNVMNIIIANNGDLYVGGIFTNVNNNGTSKHSRLRHQMGWHELVCPWLERRRK